MKILLFLLLMTLVYFNCKAQWIKINTGINVSFTSVDFPTADIGFVAGDSGTILKTSNGGDKWIKLKSGTTAQLLAVKCVNADIAFVAGDSGLILKTTDGGQTWKRQTTNISAPVFSLCIIDKNNCFAAGGRPGAGYILKSTDGGSVWDTFNVSKIVPKGSAKIVSSIHFPTSMVGFAAITNGVLKTIDGGKSWFEANHAANSDDTLVSILRACYFTDSNTGFAGGFYGQLLAGTTNGGVTWSKINTSNIINAIHFATSETGYAAGQSNSKMPFVYKTSDNGKHWFTDLLDTAGRDHQLNAIHMVDDKNGFAVGDNKGIVYKRSGNNNGAITPVANISDINLQLYPNPTRDETFLDICNYPYPLNEPAIEVTAYDALARKQLLPYQLRPSPSGSGVHISMNTSCLKPGIYFINIKISDYEFSVKSIVQ